MTVLAALLNNLQSARSSSVFVTICIDYDLDKVISIVGHWLRCGGLLYSRSQSNLFQ